ncbi:MAG: metallophosphoesterase family protein [Planctomycetota bacterium]|nr:metallophosphoesterase family protein [Planctomycetota bacterium]
MKCFLGVILTVAVVLAPEAMAQEAKPAEEKKPKEFNFSKDYPARKIPDRIALSISGDPATSVSVTWRTSKVSGKPVAELAKATAGPEFTKQKIQFKAKTQKLPFKNADSYYHSVTFNQLEPDTQYVYRVGHAKNFSEWSEFKTAKLTDDQFSFVYFGDAQNSIKAMWSRVSRRGLRDMPNASFFLHAGDLINTANSDTDWGEWFYAGGWINRSIPIVASPGNHEYGDGGLSRHWRVNFEFPSNGPKGLEESAYYFDYQGTRVISLNTNRDLDKQAKWLDQVLSGSQSNWTILTGHHPFYSPAKDRDNSSMRQQFAPIFKKHRIDLCLQGHDHTYARTFQTELKKEYESTQGARHIKNGTVFAVSVSGPKMYYSKKESIMQRVAEGTQLYQLITVEKNKISYKALTATGELYDEFELLRNGDEVQIRDLAPKTPERKLPEPEPEPPKAEEKKK